jgi:outer membrane lipoprotein-sorting protein
MKKIFMLGVILGSVIFAVAQQDSKAKEILDEVSRNTRSWKSVSADFIYSMENNEMDIHEKNEGSIRMKGEKYVVVLPGIGWEIYSDGKTIWNYMKDGNQVTISDMDSGGNDLMTPSALFTIYEQGFRPKLTGEKMIGDQACYEIELYPDSEAFDVTRIVLNISKSDKMIKSARLYGTDENLYGIEVTKIHTGDVIPDEFFVFQSQEHDDIEVIDFR